MTRVGSQRHRKKNVLSVSCVFINKQVKQMNGKKNDINTYSANVENIVSS